MKLRFLIGMNNILFLFAAILTLQTQAQITITLDLTTGAGQDLYISNYPGWENLNLNPDPDFAAVAWTSGSTPYLGRSMAMFDLSSIPAGATITSASLNLYGNPAPIHTPGHSNLSGSNVATLRRIVSAWNENTTTWNTQPTTTIQNEVLLPSSATTTQDYLNIDVTSLVQDMYNDPLNSFGFMIQLITEQHYRALNFASGNSSNTAKHPKLTVCFTTLMSIPYHENKRTINIFPNPTNSELNIRFVSETKEKIEIKFYDAVARVVMNENFISTVGSNEKRFDLTELNPGIYFIEIATGNEIIRERIVVNR